jgi:hypothetical protein
VTAAAFRQRLVVQLKIAGEYRLVLEAVVIVRIGRSAPRVSSFNHNSTDEREGGFSWITEALGTRPIGPGRDADCIAVGGYTQGGIKIWERVTPAVAI